nr:MAG TPA: hypothetical protein [Caudoviricetes sp.]
MQREKIKHKAHSTNNRQTSIDKRIYKRRKLFHLKFGGVKHLSYLCSVKG